jgi:hypothetical protein
MTELFTDGTTPTEPVSADPETNYLEVLVGDDKKFKSVDDLARGKYESDMYIEKLHQELEGMREDLYKRSTMEELLDQMKSSTGNTEQVGSGQPASTEHSSSPDSEKVTLSQKELKDFVEQQINSKLSEQEKIDNLKSVETMAKERYGADYQAKLTARAKELELGEQFLIDLAAEKPAAFAKLMLPEGEGAPSSESQRPASMGIPASSTSAVPSVGRGKKNFAYYEKLRKENKTHYWSAPVQQEMWREAKAQGKDFYS